MSAFDLLQYAAALSLVAGGLFSLLAAIGILRLPDLYTRMHAASKAGVVGAGLVLIAVAVVSLDAAVGLRAVLGIVFLLLTTPVSAHLLARAAYNSSIRPVGNTNISDTRADTPATTEDQVAEAKQSASPPLQSQ